MLIERQSGMNSMLMVTMPTTIVKRDGRIVPFDIERIENAMARCFASAHRTPGTPIPHLARQVVNIIAARSEQPIVEAVQDTVEMVLQAAGEYEAAKRYILYRAEHAKQRVVALMGCNQPANCFEIPGLVHVNTTRGSACAGSARRCCRRA